MVFLSQGRGFTYFFTVLLEVVSIASITVSVSKELKQKMGAFPKINWNAVAINAIQNEIDYLVDQENESEPRIKPEYIEKIKKLNKQKGKRFKNVEELRKEIENA